VQTHNKAESEEEKSWSGRKESKKRGGTRRRRKFNRGEVAADTKAGVHSRRTPSGARGGDGGAKLTEGV